MSFTGTESQFVSLLEGSDLTSNYRASAGLNPVLGQYFSQETITDILAQEGCVGVRVYYGLSDTGVKQLVMVGVTSSEDDLYNGLIADKSFICPPLCGATNPLNS